MSNPVRFRLLHVYTLTSEGNRLSVRGGRTVCSNTSTAGRVSNSLSVSLPRKTKQPKIWEKEKDNQSEITVHGPQVLKNILSQVIKSDQDQGFLLRRLRGERKVEVLEDGPMSQHSNHLQSNLSNCWPLFRVCIKPTRRLTSSNHNQQQQNHLPYQVRLDFKSGKY